MTTTKFQPGKSGNPAGRPKGSGGKYKKTKEMLAAEKDIARAKRFYRAVLTNDLDVLADEFGVNTVSVANKMDANKAIERIAREDLKQAKEDAARDIALRKLESASDKGTQAVFHAATPILKRAVNG